MNAEKLKSMKLMEYFKDTTMIIIINLPPYLVMQLVMTTNWTLDWYRGALAKVVNDGFCEIRSDVIYCSNLIPIRYNVLRVQFSHIFTSSKPKNTQKTKRSTVSIRYRGQDKKYFQKT